MRKLVLAIALVLVASGAQAATLNVVNGQLMGASNVLVDGSLYDVQFLDGSCIDLYNGCDDVSDFTFTDEVSALLAAQALIQFYLGGNYGPLYISGCANPFGSLWCGMVTPYRVETPGILYLSSAVVDTTGSGSPWVGLLTHYPSTPSTDSSWDAPVAGGHVFAVWSPVPEPSTALLLGLGLVGMAARRRSLR